MTLQATRLPASPRSASLLRRAHLLPASPRSYGRFVHLPHFLRRVNRVFTNPIMGTFAWLVPPLAVIHHVGRKSGRPYRSPVVAVPTANGFAIPMTYGRDVDWARNVIAAGGCDLERAGRRVRLTNPRIVGLREAEPLLPVAVRGFFRLADFPGFVLADT